MDRQIESYKCIYTNIVIASTKNEANLFHIGVF